MLHHVLLDADGVVQLGGALDELLIIDDSDVNVAAARTCGLHAIRWHHDQGKDDLDRLLATQGP